MRRRCRPHSGRCARLAQTHNGPRPLVAGTRGPCAGVLFPPAGVPRCEPVPLARARYAPGLPEVAFRRLQPAEAGWPACITAASIPLFPEAVPPLIHVEIVAAIRVVFRVCLPAG